MKFGLIGYPLSHSFSKRYFTEKFALLGLTDFTYDLIPIKQIEDIRAVLLDDLFGLNVTVPYKTLIISYLNDIDRVALAIGAVNTLVKTGNCAWKGYNTDAIGFKESLQNWFGELPLPKKALVLGTGGSSRAVFFMLQQLGIETCTVSRSDKGDIRYEDVTPELIEEYLLIINTTPLGMSPDDTTCPMIPYHRLTDKHWLYDLVYNPANTLFLQHGQQMEAKTKNGIEMLHIQAEHAWAIWKSYGKF